MHCKFSSVCGAWAGAGNAIGAVRLLEADTSLMQRSGADRVRLLAKSSWAHEILLREGAPAKLLALLCNSTDQSGRPSAVLEFRIKKLVYKYHVCESSWVGLMQKATAVVLV